MLFLFLGSVFLVRAMIYSFDLDADSQHSDGIDWLPELLSSFVNHTES
jgi:hypothetical protein